MIPKALPLPPKGGSQPEKPCGQALFPLMRVGGRARDTTVQSDQTEAKPYPPRGGQRSQKSHESSHNPRGTGGRWRSQKMKPNPHGRKRQAYTLGEGPIDSDRM